MEEQYRVALGILTEKRPLLERAVIVLLEKEKIQGDELKALMATVPASLPSPGHESLGQKGV